MVGAFPSFATVTQPWNAGFGEATSAPEKMAVAPSLVARFLVLLLLF